MGDGTAAIDAVVIGRNEGDRLVACLASLRGCVRRVIYVDSGSTDGSVQAARAAGAEVVELDLSRPFTAARARNAGLARIYGSGAAYVQLIDGDCTVDPDWIATAGAFLEARPDVAVACGRRRERHPEASVYNRLCDREWNTPPGEALACGGDALMRLRALELVGGFDPALIAGEEPELCQRLRRAGWTIWRLDAEMTCHDADMHRFGQWWRRSRRAGYAFAEGAQLHGRGPDRFWRRETLRALSWGAALPLLTLGLALFISPWALLLLLAYPAQVVRLALRDGGGREAWEAAFFTVLGRFPEAQGALEYHIRRLIGHRRGILEYK
ncbi:glycosyltransferase family 2 protein [Jhaorihella thermophila]|uniref:Glycosyltransferase, GT2 family n=1 Tax=Jhaorihella thermophila TaxID=488547 RepID=A0A1H5TEV5_9RHOB|nr:glycosyltransferase [Jhaorihella thermophila]SEF61329.1 Glycosyltransferase, GT2 family [Jhaorihella thermophila]